jgi:alkylation response protein AidB-like acyl-CoA dehydrogenase
MELSLSGSEEEFARELRAWLDSVLPRYADRPDFNDSVARVEFDRRWQAEMFRGGWSGVAWPREFGGRGATLFEQLIYHEITAELDAPQPGLNFVGLYHAGPTIMRAGTTEQQQRWLPPILSGEEMWCQGFSEPDAGSDLAGVSCRAEVEGSEIVINGTKIWTSNAHVADVAELVVRSDRDHRHGGLTYLICEMDRPGIEVRNITQIDGCPEFNEVSFREVRVPLDNVLGEVGGGWKVAMTTLGFERSTAFIDRELRLQQRITALGALAKEVGRADGTMTRLLGQVASEVETLRSMVYREVSRLASGADSGAEGSILKLYFAELDQRIGRLIMELLGEDVIGFDRDDGSWIARYFRTLSSSIAAGTSQVQRNIVGERILGLPREGAPA